MLNFDIKYFFESIASRSYWKYLFSKDGIKSIFAIYGVLWLIIESLDFFRIYTRDQYESYALFIFLIIAIVISIFLKRPVKSISISFPEYDFGLEVRVANIFDINGAIMISTNTSFEADVANGKINPNSLQGQFTSRYFPGNQIELIDKINGELKRIEGNEPYPMGTTIPINTHGKTFYLTAMANIGEGGNASATVDDVKNALNGLWKHVREIGELQELAVPVIGTARGRVELSRKKMIALISESFVEASKQKKFTDKLIITIRPEDSKDFGINLYDIKDHLKQVLKS